MSTSNDFLLQELDKQMQGFYDAIQKGELERLQKAKAAWESAEYYLNAMEDDELEEHRERLLKVQDEAERVMDESSYYLDADDYLILKDQ